MNSKLKMKREHPETPSTAEEEGGGSSSKCSKSMWDDDDGDGGMDELLAVLGYKVKSCDMPDVAQKLEQLEMAMGNTEDGISHLSSDTVHYNPSDISGWLESMLSEITPEQTNSSSSIIINNHAPLLSDQHRFSPSSIASGSSSTNPFHQNQHQIFEDNSEYDLRLIPGIAAYTTNNNNNKRSKHHDGSGVQVSSQSVNSAAAAPRPLVLVDSQEAGVRLVHTLMACAEAVHNDNLMLAETFLKQIGLLAASQAGAMRRVATYFAKALARRIYKVCPLPSSIDSSYSDDLLMHFYETCPYLKFAHFTANQAILEAFAGADRVHLIDFSIKQGLQWPPLMQYLALRPGGPPAFRLTAIGPPQPDNTDALQQVGWKLAQFAKTIGVEFQYRGFVCESLADLNATMLDVKAGETVAVNSVFELHRLLARPSAMEKVMNTIREVKPRIVTVVEQEANHNGPVFLDRFNEALYYYSAMFDSLEGCGLTQSSSQQGLQNVLRSEMYLGRQIFNVVACEGEERVERHESLVQWRGRMESAGFDPVHLGSNAFKQARMLLALFAGSDGYRVEENGGCLMLGWHTLPVIATSAWRLASATAN